MCPLSSVLRQAAWADAVDRMDVTGEQAALRTLGLEKRYHRDWCHRDITRFMGIMFSAEGLLPRVITIRTLPVSVQ